MVLLAALTVTLSRVGTEAAQAPPGQPSASSSAESAPPSTAGFVAAYGRGDMGAMEALASPLYFAEWARRGVSLNDQASLIQEHQRAPTGEWLILSYATGFVDGRGFGHYLYVGRPISTAGSPSASVWRVDADAAGRVIWIEMVWLFNDRSLAFDVLRPDGARNDSALRSLLPSRPTDVIFGVRSPDGIEGYYGVAQLPGVESAARGRNGVQFYVVDDSGVYRLPAWTYGERIPNRPLADRQQLQPEQASVLGDYLASIR